MTAHTNITLFKNTKFYKHQNYKIDNIDDFLISLSSDKIDFENLQYFKVNDISREFKLDLSQKGIREIHKYNYARIDIYNSDGTHEWRLYFFVDEFNWISSSCIKLIMSMDTLNSQLDELIFSNRTLIEREHVDRFDYNAIHFQGYSFRVLKKIPNRNENMNPQKYKHFFDEDEWKIKKQYSFDFYKNKMFLSENGYKSGETISLYDLEDLSDGWFKINTARANDAKLHTYIVSDSGKQMFLKPYGSQEAYWIMSDVNNLDLSSVDNFKILHIPYAPIRNMANYKNYTDASHLFQNGNTYNSIHTNYSDVPGTYYSGIEIRQKIRNTDLKEMMVKISSHTYRVNENDVVKGYGLDTIQTHIFSASVNDKRPLKSQILDNGIFKSLGYANESASLNSEFCSFKFSYGGFEHEMNFEDFTWKGSSYTSYEVFPFFEVYFSIGRNVDNNIYFHFVPSSNFEYNETKIDENVMIIPLETELPLSSSSYLNYMRNGYNFDVKLKENARERRELGYLSENWATGRSMITTNPISLLKAGVKMGEDVFIQGQEERLARMQESLEMDKKIAELKGSKVSISQVNGGIDKINYSQFVDKMEFSIMLPREEYWDYIDDYFYFFGSKCQYYGIPSHNNRCLFDYLKCNAEFINRNSIVNSAVLRDIIERLKNGVTFIHKHLNTYTFDYEKKENIEINLLELL